MIKIWDSEGNKIEELEGHKNSVLDIIPITSQILISCSRDGSIIIWKKGRGKQFKKTSHLKLHESTVLALAKLNEQSFLSCGADGIVNQIDVNGNLLGSIKAHDEWIWAVKVLSDSVIATIGEDGFIKVWKLGPFRKIDEMKIGPPLTAMEYDEERKMLFVGNIKGTVTALHFSEDFCISKKFDHQCHRDKIWVIKCKGEYIATGGEDNSVKVWKKWPMKKVDEYRHKNFVQDLIWVNETIISASYDGKICVNTPDLS